MFVIYLCEIIYVLSDSAVACIRSSSGAAVPQVDRRSFVFYLAKKLLAMHFTRGTFAGIERENPRNSIAPDKSRFPVGGLLLVLSCLRHTYSRFVFDVNRCSGRTHKHSGRSNFIFSLDA